MVEPTINLFKKWRLEGKPITALRMDNGGENIKLAKMCQAAVGDIGVVKVEFTARNTPQQNAPVEVGFATLGSRAKAIMNRAGIPDDLRYKVYLRALRTSTQLDGLITDCFNGKVMSRYEAFTGARPTFATNLRTWGEAGVVKIKTATSPKINNKGIVCMFTGYPDSHSSQCMEMWDHKTDGYHLTRDVVWLGRMYFGGAIGWGKEITEPTSNKVGEGNRQDAPNSEDKGSKNQRTMDSGQK